MEKNLALFIAHRIIDRAFGPAGHTISVREEAKHFVPNFKGISLIDLMQWVMHFLKLAGFAVERDKMYDFQIIVNVPNGLDRHTAFANLLSVFALEE